MRHLPVRCPCGSGERYAECCGALHEALRSGGASAPTAERLMRSRFSAFAVGDADYLLATWHPSTRPPALELAGDVQWRQLDIVDVEAGGEADATGIVEFVAYYADPGTGALSQLRERSRFARVSGQWRYVDAV